MDDSIVDQGFPVTRTPSKNKAPRKPRPSELAAKKTKKPAATVVRSERMDFRLSKTEKARIVAVAKRQRRTVTSVVIEAIEKIK